MNRLRRTLLGAAGLASMGLARGQGGGESELVVYPRHQALQDAQMAYVLRLMMLALARSGRPYRFQQTATVMVQSRALIELAKPNAPIDVFWTMTNPQREQTLLPVRIPLERGLIGWRQLLVRKGDLARWQRVARLSDLANFTAGQMHDWPDTPILRANGLTVQTSTHYESLFTMLARGRIDYFPRSLIEIHVEQQAHRHLELEIEPRLLLHYPAALYFFVSPARPRLAVDLEHGLEAMQADGTFERLFQQQFGTLLTPEKFAQHHVLRLHNPELPTATPLTRKELWWSPPGALRA